MQTSLATLLINTAAPCPVLPQFDAPVVTKAFLKHDMETLGEHCGPEIMQRLEGLCKAFQQQVRITTLRRTMYSTSELAQS